MDITSSEILLNYFMSEPATSHIKRFIISEKEHYI